jgi:cobalt-precorrin-5B (C1)-methyltransferase
MCTLSLVSVAVKVSKIILFHNACIHEIRDDIRQESRALKKKRLKSGYTTGACAAAAAKAAVELLLSAEAGKRESARDNKNLRACTLTSFRSNEVEIPFPDSSRVCFEIYSSRLKTHDSELIATASVIKDAGDDPDVTHGAEIVAEATIVRKRGSGEASEGTIHELPLQIIIKGGKGVGIVTKPGLSVPVGEAAINPVPRQMIQEAVGEALGTEAGKRGSTEGIKNLPASSLPRFHALEIRISVPQGEELARKTLNYRLGIVGGISILGTTGIVKPVSTDAWTATIASSMDVAKATGVKEIVLSAGRSSEKAYMNALDLPEESYVLMGDHLEYSLLEARKHEFKKVHLCAQWAKMLKIAMATPQTHVRFGAIDIQKAVEFLNSLGINVPREKDFNTAREIFDFITFELLTPDSVFISVCNAAKNYAESITGGVPVMSFLVSYRGEILAKSE